MRKSKQTKQKNNNNKTFWMLLFVAVFLLLLCIYFFFAHDENETKCCFCKKKTEKKPYDIDFSINICGLFSLIVKWERKVRRYKIMLFVCTKSLSIIIAFIGTVFAHTSIVHLIWSLLFVLFFFSPFFIIINNELKIDVLHKFFGIVHVDRTAIERGLRIWHAACIMRKIEFNQITVCNIECIKRNAIFYAEIKFQNYLKISTRIIKLAEKKSCSEKNNAPKKTPKPNINLLNHTFQNCAFHVN